MIRVLLGVMMATSLAQLARPSVARSLTTPPPPNTYTYRMLSNPTTGDEFMFRGAIQQTAQNDSNKLYNPLVSLLGGSAPQLNFVQPGSAFLKNGDSSGDTSSNIDAQPGAPQGTINIDPAAVEALTNNASTYHNSGVGSLPHEFAHLHQTPQTLAQILTSEGGAQAFEDAVTPHAAQVAGIPYSRDYVSPWDSYLSTIQAAPYGRNWIMGSQFGKTAPPNWP